MIALPYLRQPVGSIRPNYRNTWLDRATGLWVFSQPYNLITGEPTALTGTAYYGSGPSGVVARTVSGTNRVQLASDSSSVLSTNGSMTIALHYRKIGAAAATAGFGVDASADGSRRCGTHFPFSDGTLYWDYGGNASGVTRLTAASLTYGDDFWVFTVGPRGMEIWQNGILRASNAATPTRSSTTNAFLLGMHGTATNADDAECAILLSGVRQWSPAECAAWTAQTAWEAVEPVVLYVKPGAGGTTGTVNYTNANDTLAASGTTTVTGTLATTNANDTLAAAGTTTVVGTLAYTNANDTLAAAGTVGGGVDGSVNYTNNNDTLAAAGTTTVTGTLAYTNANDTLAASGVVGSVTGTVDYTNNNDTLQASGTAGQPGTLVIGGGFDKPRKKRKPVRESILEAMGEAEVPRPAASLSPLVAQEPIKVKRDRMLELLLLDL